jgi:hypothetical protein
VNHSSAEDMLGLRTAVSSNPRTTSITVGAVIPIVSSARA